MWSIVKLGLGLIAGGCAAQVAGQIIKVVIPPAFNVAGKVVQTVGAIMITGVVASKASDYIEELAEDVKGIFKPSEEELKAPFEDVIFGGATEDS